MRTRFPFVLAMLASSAFAGTCLAQGLPSHRTWSRTYGGSVSEQGLHDLRQLANGQIVVAGYTASFGGPTQASWLMNLDTATGDVTAERTSTSTFGGFTDGAAIAPDGGALFLGRDVLDIFTKHDAWMMRVDAGGEVDWSLGFTRPGAGRHFLFDAAELDDGSWVAVGATGIFAQPPQAAWIVRVRSNGQLLWQYEYGGGVADTARAVTLTSDGGIAVAGWTNSSGAGSDDVLVMKLDAAGTVQWQKTYGGVDAEQAEEIVELDDGGFAVAGYTNSLTHSGHAPWLLRLDSAGSLLWHKAVDEVWGDLGAVSQTSDGELIVVGRVSESGFPSNDLWSAELASADGSPLWQRAYEGALGDFGSAVLPLACSGFALGGTWGWGFAGESIWIQRTDATGGLSNCGIMRSTSFPLVSPKITEQSGTLVRVPGGAQLELPGIQLAPSEAVVTELCSPVLPILEIPRAGVPPNPNALLPGTTSGPTIGSTWDPVIDHTTFLPDALTDFLAVSFAPDNVSVPTLGTILCTLPVSILIPATAGEPFEAVIPDDCNLVGVELCTQGVSVNAAGDIRLTNALDVTLGGL